MFLCAFIIFENTDASCLALGDSCTTSSYNADYQPCCGEDTETATCMSPRLHIVGSTECRTCAAEYQPCNRRTDCCTNCCNNGVCIPDYDNCNFSENMSTAFLIMVLFFVCACIFACCFYCFCFFLIQAIEKIRSSVNTTDTDTENEE